MNVTKTCSKSHIEHETLHGNRENVSLDNKLGENEKENSEEKSGPVGFNDWGFSPLENTSKTEADRGDGRDKKQPIVHLRREVVFIKKQGGEVYWCPYKCIFCYK